MAGTREDFMEEIGRVTEQERNEIQLLFERKNALIELSRSLVAIDKEELDNSPLYEKIVTDLGKVSTKFQGWWDEKSVKYNWKKVKGCNWQINFDTCIIYLANGELPWK